MKKSDDLKKKQLLGSEEMTLGKATAPQAGGPEFGYSEPM